MAFFCAPPRRFAALTPGQFAWCWVGLWAYSVFWGVALALTWNVAHELFGEMSGVKIMPALVSCLLITLLPFREATISLATVLARRRPPVRALIISGIMVTLALGMICARPIWHTNSSVPMNWLWPHYLAEEARPLLLMPIWGCWAMLVASQFCRPTQATEPAIHAMARGCGPLPPAATIVIPWVTTWLYFSAWHMLMSPVTTVLGVVAGIAICRWAGGLTRRNLLATNLLTQLAFFAQYLHHVRL